jgi:mannose-6-phosphate isomerase-like protein (cupin superfamily)
VVAPEDVAWHQTDLGPNFWISDKLVDTEYSSPHHHEYNHAFYFVNGTGRIQLDGQLWETKPGTFVKVSAEVVHSLVNTGADDLVFLVVYDPPHVATD